MLDLRADDSSPSLALTLVPEPSTVVISAGKYSSLEARGTDVLGETSSELERWTVGSRTSEAVVAMSVSVGVGGGRKKRAASGVLLACFLWSRRSKFENRRMQICDAGWSAAAQGRKIGQYPGKVEAGNPKSDRYVCLAAAGLKLVARTRTPITFGTLQDDDLRHQKPRQEGR